MPSLFSLLFEIRQQAPISAQTIVESKYERSRSDPGLGEEIEVDLVQQDGVQYLVDKLECVACVGPSAASDQHTTRASVLVATSLVDSCLV